MTEALVVLAILLAGIVVYRRGVASGVGRGAARQRELFEDALKLLLDCEQRGDRAGVDLLAGAFRLSRERTTALLEAMQQREIVRLSGPSIELTVEGRAWALQVMRAHRLWERYFADEAGLPLDQVHREAHRAEHLFDSEAIDELDARLGHPLRDPHGDPIPQSDGTLDAAPVRPLAALTVGEEFRIVHIEDEPEATFRAILQSGVRPEMVLTLREKDERALLLSDGERNFELSHQAAANIQVTSAQEKLLQGAKRLSELQDGEEARIVALDRQCRGFTRRRLLDLGLTPETRIRAELRNAFGDPRAFRVRSTLVALRRDQARYVWVQAGQ